MRLAIAGKGGAGKTTTSSTIARLLAQQGCRVVCIDGDANPNLAIALGLPPDDAFDLTPIPSSLVSRRLGGAGLIEPLEDILDSYAITGPDDIRLLGMGSPGHAGEGCLCSAHAVVSALLEDLGTRDDTVVVVDMEASPEHLSRGTVKHADILVLIAEPYYRSLETTRRMAALGAELPVQVAVIANKIRSESDAEAVAEFCVRHELRLLGNVPWSDAVIAADRTRVSVVDAPETGDVTAAISAICEQLGLLDASAASCLRSSPVQ